MEHFFWHQRWEKNEISFHEGKANANLVRYFTELALAPGARVFLPLCGKTRDITWLLSHGYRVAGAELRSSACAPATTRGCRHEKEVGVRSDRGVGGHGR